MYDDFQEIELKYYCFINLEKFNLLNSEDKYNFLIKNNILIKTNKSSFSYRCVYDSVPFIYKEKLFDFDNLFDYKGYDYEINEDIKEEFYNYLKVRIENLIYVDPYYDIDEIKYKLKFYNNKKKIKLLNKIKNKNINILTENGGYKLYFNEKCNGYNDWKELVMDTFAEELFLYLSKGIVNVKTSYVIPIWIKLFEANTILEFCEKELHTLRKEDKFDSKSKTNIIDTITEENFNKIVFRGFKEERLFIKWLLEKGVFDDNKKTKLQVFCDAFFRSKYKEEIFKHPRYKSDFLKHLNKFFDLSLNTEKCTISDGINHIESVNEFIDKNLDFLK